MRLLTRSDFDGLACAVLLMQAGIVDSWKFTHPKDLQDGIIAVNGNDVLANVPFVPGCGMWFDHHSSEAIRGIPKDFKGAWKSAPSAARVIWDYCGGEKTFGSAFLSMMEAVDKVDSANLSPEEILNPAGWILLGYIMDPRTGLGRFREFKISNYTLMEHMIEYCRRPMPAEEILQLPDVAERIRLYQEHKPLFIQMIEKRTTLHGKCALIDFREQDPIYAGNRFMVYAMFPQCNVSAHVLWGLNRQNVAITVGKSILDRGNKVDVGALMLQSGGGGHSAVGTCQVPTGQAEEKIKEIVAALNS
jgi:nanoRNase/pAp phosphatase (c-di-AMP/oligoRNAs hydrolase)